VEGEGGQEGLFVATAVASANAATAIASATACPPDPCVLEKASTQGVSATTFFFQYITTGVMPPFDSGDKHRATLTASWFEAMASVDELRTLRPQVPAAVGMMPPTPNEGIQRRLISKLHDLVRLRLRDAFSALPKITDTSSSSGHSSKKRRREAAWPKSLDTPLLLGSLESRVKELKKWGVVVNLGEFAEWRRTQESGLGMVKCDGGCGDNEEGNGSGEAEISGSGSGPPPPIGSGGFWEAPAHLLDLLVGKKGIKK